MAENQKTKGALFTVRPAKDGNSWSVFCATGFGTSIEILDFSCEKAGRYWIDTVSRAWLEKAKAGRLSDRRKIGSG